MVQPHFRKKLPNCYRAYYPTNQTFPFFSNNCSLFFPKNRRDGLCFPPFLQKRWVKGVKFVDFFKLIGYTVRW